MRKYRADIDERALIAEILSVPLERIPDGSGSKHGERGTEGWITGLSMARINIAEYAELTRAIVLLLKQRPMVGLVQVMVNKVDAGTALAPHVDAKPDNLRFHLPVITHPLVEWWDEVNGKRVMSPGWWYGPVPYCGKLHSMSNRSPIDRIHVVADFQRE